MDFLALLGNDGFIKYSKELAHATSTNAAIIFGQLCSSHNSYKNKNMLTMILGQPYFYITSEQLFEETALSYRQQKAAIDLLEKEGYIKTEKYGVPAKKYYHITRKIFLDFLGENTSDNPRNDKSANLEMAAFSEDENAENVDMSSIDKSAILETTFPQNKNEQKRSTIKKKKEKELIKKKEEEEEKNNINNSNRVNNKISALMDFLMNQCGLKNQFKEYGIEPEKIVIDCAKYLVKNGFNVVLEEPTKKAIENIIRYAEEGGDIKNLGSLIGSDTIKQHAIMNASAVLKAQEEAAAAEEAEKESARKVSFYNWLDEREENNDVHPQASEQVKKYNS